MVSRGEGLEGLPVRGRDELEGAAAGDLSPTIGVHRLQEGPVPLSVRGSLVMAGSHSLSPFTDKTVMRDTPDATGTSLLIP